MDNTQIQQEQSTGKTLGIISLVASGLGLLFFLPFIGSVAGIVCGHISMSKFKKIAPVDDGKVLGLIGLILGYVGLAIFILLIILYIAFFTYIFTNIDIPEVIQEGNDY